VIVTDNLKDFPPAALEAWDMEAKSADDFILDQIDSAAKRSTAPSNGSPTPARTRRRRSPMCSPCSSAMAS
jgi:hypothetical protein